MVKVRFVEFIKEIFMQGDTRYADNHDAVIVADFLEKGGINVKKSLIMSIDNPLDKDLKEIHGPQKIYKLMGKRLLEAAGYTKVK